VCAFLFHFAFVLLTSSCVGISVVSNQESSATLPTSATERVIVKISNVTRATRDLKLNTVEKVSLVIKHCTS
jgi:hypothetical protein